MSAKKMLFTPAADTVLMGIELLAPSTRAFVSAHLAERLEPTVTIKTALGSIDLWCPGTIPLWRANTLLTKEPVAIKWIGILDENDAFWAIGAGLGSSLKNCRESGHYLDWLQLNHEKRCLRSAGPWILKRSLYNRVCSRGNVVLQLRTYRPPGRVNGDTIEERNTA